MRLATFLIGLTLVAAMWNSGSAAEPAGTPANRAKAEKALANGNFNDAYQVFRVLALDPKDDPNLVSADFDKGLQCLRNLGRIEEVDAFREGVIKAHDSNWRLLNAAAQTLLSGESHGFIVAGEFYRGQHRGGGKAVNCYERDRVRALQLLVKAMPLAAKDNNRREAAGLFQGFANALLGNRGYGEAWRLQYLTDLATLPDYDEGWNFWNNNGAGGAPVDAEGKPVFHAAARTYEAAKTDGERWRWAMNMAVEMDPSLLNSIRWQWADFLYQQFGEQTLAYYGWFFGRMDEDNGQKNESGTYALHTLKPTETIARLATGVKRFDLPDEFNFIKVYQQIANEPKTGYGAEALEQLAHVHENRRQYPQAADYWKQTIAKYGAGQDNYRKAQLNQIIGNWGRFENVMTQPAGQGASVEFTYRNAAKVSFEATEIAVPKLLDDIKAYLKSNARQFDWQKVNIGDLGYRLVLENQKQYLGAKVANWDLELKPRENHFDKRVTVTTPLQKPGAYLVKATVANGNTTYIVLWVADTAIVKKPLDKGTFYFVADAVTGKPIEKANLEFFGWRGEHTQPNKFQILTKNFSELSDADGQLVLKGDEEQTQYQWLTIARTQNGRFAYLGFHGIWTGQYYDSEYNQTKVFTITDRPVYRPGQKVHFKFWVRHAKYDQEDVSDFAGQKFTVELHDPKGNKTLTKEFLADAYGGIEGEYDLPANATLGVYSFNVVNHGGGQFRVEEYKKPEYEVLVEAPKEPVMLGEKITAKIEAKYFFGAPVAKAKVKYKIERSNLTAQWYPLGDWDWLYGRGYWWFACDYPWYPGWANWGCSRPAPWWWMGPQQPPEIVAEREAQIGPDGKLSVEIDTSLAKAVHGSQDHQYNITVEVTDESRRTIVGQGSVMVARKPFKVYSWIDRGYYRIGDTVKTNFSVQTLDQKPVKGKGKLAILKITYDKDRKPIETPVREYDLETDAQGQANLQFKASLAGQFRLAYNVTDDKQHTVEGGYVFTIIGDGFDGADFRFNNLELIPNKREFVPGESVNLQVNTDRVGGTVLLFIRPANGIYLKPKVLRLKGKSAVEEIAVIKKDMPNFFIEAITVNGAKIHTETKEIVVPPEKRVLNVDVVASAETYKPGQAAKIRVKLTDFNGKPFVGSTVVAMYDKALEYISGGSNVPEIKDFFWKWRRSHHVQTESSLQQYSGNVDPLNKPGMSNLGIFGAEVADELADDSTVQMEMLKDGGHITRGATFGAGGLGGGGGPVPAAMPAADMPREGAALAKGEATGLALDPGNPAAQGGGAAPLVQPMIRSKFADTAYWAGSLTTDKDGLAEIALNMPENLTSWKILVWGMGHGTKVGQGESAVTTSKDLLVRLQAPRFFVEKDEVVLSANIHNYLKKAKRVTAQLTLGNDTIAPLGGSPAKPIDGKTVVEQVIEIPAGGEQRVDWRVAVKKEGEALIRMSALTDEDSDAMEQRFPVYVHGMLKMDSFAGVIRPEKDSTTVTIKVPAERRINESRLEIRYSPTLAGAMVDALPYMLDYPYGCTEQTLNRFLPAAITQKVLIGMGLDLKAIRDKRTNLNAQEIGDDQARAKQWKRFDHNPVFDQDEMTKIVKEGVNRLTEMQLSDGGWGWFSGWGEHSSPHTTAVVVHGLQIAQANDVALVPGTLDRGVAWLKNYQEKQVRLLKNADLKPKPKEWKDKADNLDALIYMVLVDAGVKSAEMQDYLYRDRVNLAVYAKAVYGLALHKQGVKDKLAMILQNIQQFVVQDEENQTAWLRLPEDNYWWCWYGSDFEAMSYYLKLLSQTDPKGELASRLVKYVLNNRKHATYWNSTRDSALCIEALADYLKASGESKPDLTLEILIDGKKEKEVKITAADLFTFDNKLVLLGDAVTSGTHKIEFRKKGIGPLYFNAYLTNFTLEDRITKAGLEVKVNRKFYKLVSVDKQIKVSGDRGQALDQKVEKYERRELADLATLKSGDLVEVELEIDSKNDYEYILFEDLKAAGFEPTEVRSGYTANGLGAYTEYRDNRVCFFVQNLARGKHSVAYRLRAEIPGKFSALPATAAGMYAPELRGNSDEFKVQVTD